jgi:hypothetical protein
MTPPWAVGKQPRCHARRAPRRCDLRRRNPDRRSPRRPLLRALEAAAKPVQRGAAVEPAVEPDLDALVLRAGPDERLDPAAQLAEVTDAAEG